VSRVGKCLIARPGHNGGFFRKSVVYIYEDSSHGTVGVALSKPSNYTLKSVDPKKIPNYTAADPIVYNGGPVNKSAVMMLHSDDFVSTNTMFLPDGFGISSDMLMIDKMYDGNWPKHFRLTVGASVWQPGQLEFEFNRNLWLEADLDLTQIFDMDQESLWGWAVEQASKQTIDRFF
jgi:putative transcriptional regulator